MILRLSLSAIALAVLSACGGGGTYEDDKKLSKNEKVISQVAFAQESVKAFLEVDTGLKKLTDEFNSFTLNVATTITYGSNGVYSKKLLQAGTYTCGNALFGDPLPGILKSCFEQTGTITELKKLSDEFSSFTLKTATTISYGINGVYNKKLLQAGTYSCGNDVFGDPVPGIAKSCYETPVTTTPSTDLKKLAGEFSKFTLSSSTTVTYGINGVFVTKTLQPGTYDCGNDVFGDPVPGVAKACYISSAIPPVTNPDPIVTPPVTPDATNDVSDANAYRLRASQMGTDEGIEYRYGPDAQSYGIAMAGNTYPGPRPSKSMQQLSIQRGEIQVDGVKGGRGCGANLWCGSYQIGSILGEPGDYSSSIVNVGYVPDVPPTGFLESKYWGVASLQTISVGHNTIGWSPEVSWTTYISPEMDNGSNDENTVRLAGARSGSPIGSAPLDAKPVATVRGYGRGGWINNTLTVFANGWITSSGSNTSHNFMKVKLPDGKTPTAMAISNSGEFLFVTVWDAAALKGQVAVLALSDACQWCETTPESQWGANWGQHRQRYPGLPSLGNYVDAKLVGYVDLPSNMKAPTEVAVTTGNDAGRDTGYQVIMNLWETPVQDPAVRKRILDGDLKSAVPRTGMLTVISKSEKKAAFVDLRPLFTYYRNQYLAKDQNGWNALIAARGPAPTQWPYSFDNAGEQKPSIIKVLDLPEKPTAVKMSLSRPYRAFIATQEGKLRVYDLGTKYLDQLGSGGGTPSDIVEKFSVNVGKNPTSIAMVKEKALLGGPSKVFSTTPVEQHLWVLSRGERKASLIQFDAGFNSANIFKTLQDSRMVDPIAIEDVDNHGTESYILTVADYKGKTIHNYPYGPVIMWTYPTTSACPKPNGCSLTGNQPFEYAGGFKLPGKPFHLSGSNIN